MRDRETIRGWWRNKDKARIKALTRELGKMTPPQGIVYRFSEYKRDLDGLDHD